MKLDELSTQKTSQLKKVFEQYFQQDLPTKNLTNHQTQILLTQVNKILETVRLSDNFYQSQNSPGYLKLMMLKESLDNHLDTITTKVNTKSLFEESEVAHAQVVLAAQDMVDQVQGMLEDASELQFKELPAVVDSIRNQIGADQSMSFNSEATAALSQLVQNLQGTKQQLDAALAMLTGQGATQPGAVPLPDQNPDVMDTGDTDLSLDADLEIEPETPAAKSSAGLGRERR